MNYADIVSLHLPQTPETTNIIGAREIAQMKRGGVLINNARGNLVDLEALANALRTGKLSGAAIDVFPFEPSSKDETFASPLQGLDNVILTPHVGGSTEEAQSRIGEEVSRKLADYSDIGNTVGAVNFPHILLPPRPTGTKFLQVQQNLPGELSRLNDMFAKFKINIAGQHYQAIGEIGYAVLDFESTILNPEEVLKKIRDLKGTVRARIVNPIS